MLAQAEQPQENGTGFASPKGLSFMLLIGGNLGEAQIEVDHILEMHWLQPRVQEKTWEVC